MKWVFFIVNLGLGILMGIEYGEVVGKVEEYVSRIGGWGGFLFGEEF